MALTDIVLVYIYNIDETGMQLSLHSINPCVVVTTI